MDTTLECQCGNPDCGARIDVRKGYVHITHPDGRREVRWDYCYLDAIVDKGECKWIELMLTPLEAKSLMWFLIWNYFPAVSRLYAWWHGFLMKHCYWLMHWLASRRAK